MDANGEDGLGRIQNGAVLMDEGRIRWCGPSDEAPSAPEEVDATGCVGMPGLVDCHTHTTFAGSRADEFRMRLGGANYTEILEGGGGILSTVRATRAASLETLTSLTEHRLRDALGRGLPPLKSRAVTVLRSRSRDVS